MGFFDELDVGVGRFADKMEIYRKRLQAERFARTIKSNAEGEAKRRAGGEPARPARCPYCDKDLASPDDKQCHVCGKEWNREAKAEEPRASSRTESSNSYRKAEEPKTTSSSGYREPKAEERKNASSNSYRKAEEPKATTSNSYRKPKAEEPKATSRSTSPLSSDQAKLLLGLGRTFSADELKTAWKRKVSEWHPDKLDGMADELRTLATQHVQSLNEAYALLRS